jgi:hypothetical protein
MCLLRSVPIIQLLNAPLPMPLRPPQNPDTAQARVGDVFPHQALNSTQFWDSQCGHHLSLLRGSLRKVCCRSRPSMYPPELQAFYELVRSVLTLSSALHVLLACFSGATTAQESCWPAKQLRCLNSCSSYSSGSSACSYCHDNSDEEAQCWSHDSDSFVSRAVKRSRFK